MKKWAMALLVCHGALPQARAGGTAEEVLAGLRTFTAKTTRADGSFQPGIGTAYTGMSDSAASDLAPPTYAVIVHRTFGWTLPHEERTREFFLGRQQEDGAFVNRAGTLDPM